MRRLLVTSAVLLLGLAPATLVAAGGRHDRHDGRDRGPAVELIAVTQAGRDVRGAEFSIGTVRDLRIRTWWKVRGAHVQRLELRAPGGAVYQRLSQPFEAIASDRPRRGSPRGTAVDTLLPVGGTWITEHALVGAWRIDVYLDDERTPAASAAFRLNP